MTTIIGARLRDGRRIILNDGQLTKDNNSRASTHFDKTWEHRAANGRRDSLVGVAGKPSEAILIGTVVSVYSMVEYPYVEDLFYRFTKTYKDQGVECKSSACAWIPRSRQPTQKDSSNVEHVLVHIASDFFVHVIDDCNFVTEGSGSIEARAALLGMALRDKPADVSYSEHMKAWYPTEDDVRAAMSVAINEDVFTGGTVFFHAL